MEGELQRDQHTQAAAQSVSKDLFFEHI